MAVERLELAAELALAVATPDEELAELFNFCLLPLTPSRSNAGISGLLSFSGVVRLDASDWNRAHEQFLK